MIIYGSDSSAALALAFSRLVLLALLADCAMHLREQASEQARRSLYAWLTSFLRGSTGLPHITHGAWSAISRWRFSIPAAMDEQTLILAFQLRVDSPKYCS